MSPAYHATVFLHVLAAVVWLGGMIAFALLAPILRDVGDEGLRQRLFRTVGERFRTVGWVCLGLLAVTGVEQLRFRGWWGLDVWASVLFWSSDLGRSLMGKLVAVTVMFFVQAVHDFWLGPRAGRTVAGSAEARFWRKRAAWLARFNAFMGLILVWFAVALARGG
jgi:uncharacterized membrane protein